MDRGAWWATVQRVAELHMSNKVNIGPLSLLLWFLILIFVLYWSIADLQYYVTFRYTGK